MARLQPSRLTCFSAMMIAVQFIVLPACAQRSKSYSEDLSGYRPKFSIEDDTARKQLIIDTVLNISMDHKMNVNEKVDFVLDSIDRFNQSRRYVDGYTLQVYAGQKKDDAMNAKQKIMTELPDLNAMMQYVQPKFRVTIGAYISRLEAQRDLMRLKKSFPNAILVPEKVAIVR